MAEPHKESGRKGVASFKAGAEAVDSAEEIEQLVVTFNAAIGNGDARVQTGTDRSVVVIPFD